NLAADALGNALRAIGEALLSLQQPLRELTGNLLGALLQAIFDRIQRIGNQLMTGGQFCRALVRAGNDVLVRLVEDGNELSGAGGDEAGSLLGARRKALVDFGESLVRGLG